MFKDKVVLVTGASRGIGKAIAEAFAQQGAQVILVARHAGPLEEVEKGLLAAGRDVISLPVDIADPNGIQALAMEVGANYGRVDILINNAAVAVYKPFAELSNEERDFMLGVNLQGLFNVTQAFLPGMIERRSGTVINISAAIARNGFPNLAVYSATKAGVIAFSEGLAKEVRRYGVQVYAIAPHGVNTSLYHSLFGQTDAQKLLSPERIAQEVVRVAAGQSGLRSGQTLDISL